MDKIFFFKKVYVDNKTLRLQRVTVNEGDVLEHELPPCHLLITIVVSRVASTLDFQFVLQYVMKKRKTESLLVGN